MQELTGYFLSIWETTVKYVNSICILQHKRKETENSSLRVLNGWVRILVIGSL